MLLSASACVCAHRCALLCSPPFERVAHCPRTPVARWAWPSLSKKLQAYLRNTFLVLSSSHVTESVKRLCRTSRGHLGAEHLDTSSISGRVAPRIAPYPVMSVTAQGNVYRDGPCPSSRHTRLLCAPSPEQLVEAKGFAAGQGAMLEVASRQGGFVGASAASCTHDQKAG